MPRSLSRVSRVELFGSDSLVLGRVDRWQVKGHGPYAPDVSLVAQQFGRSMHYLGLYILTNVLTLLAACILLLIFPGLRPWHWLFGTGAMIQLVIGLALLERIRG